VNKLLKLLLAGLAAAVTLAVAVGSATAGRLATSELTFRATWTPLSIQSESEGGLIIECNLTLEGSFHYRSIIKQARSLIGYVTKAAMTHPCGGAGEAWVDNGTEQAGLGVSANSLPWHVTYDGLSGLATKHKWRSDLTQTTLYPAQRYYGPMQIRR
jgi:hypothetical protein